MKHIKSFNESLSDFIGYVKKFCSENLSYLQDEGFTYHTDIDFVGGEDDECLLYINGSKEIKFIDILPDLQPFIELLSDNVLIEEIEVTYYLKSLNGYELPNRRSRKNKEKITIEKILSGEFDEPVYNIPVIISFRLELKKKKVPFLNKIKSFFSK